MAVPKPKVGRKAKLVSIKKFVENKVVEYAKKYPFIDPRTKEVWPRRIIQPKRMNFNDKTTLQMETYRFMVKKGLIDKEIFDLNKKYNFQEISGNEVLNLGTEYFLKKYKGNKEKARKDVKEKDKKIVELYNKWNKEEKKLFPKNIKFEDAHQAKTTLVGIHFIYKEILERLK
ncbi:MAG: hypothetical protein WCX82_03560 [archaeon]|jgi:hypothetical protein